jgi:DNA-binding winged helix-turn-helix (wHTH) protein/tetratricopeptide (TPR) repeat protein
MRSFDPFRLDVTNQCLWRGDTRVPLMPKPFAVLRYLVEHPGRLVTHDQLLGAIWPDTYVQPEVLRRYILEIRRALGDCAEAPKYVRTLPKRGYQFIAPVIEDSAPPVPESVSVVGSRLVGRSAALADLDRYLTRSLDGRRQVVFVVGEPGIGKTSLVDAFQHATAAIAGVAVVRGQSVEGFGGKEAYYPLLEAIGQLARGQFRPLVVETLATYAPTWLIQLPSLVGPEQHDALQREIFGASRERMVRELCEALEVLTQTVPLVLILEDLHWVDNSTLDIISAIARRRQSAKLLLLGTFRSADLILAASPLKALRQDLLLHHLTHEVELERLEESDVAEYLAAEFTPGDLPAGLAAIIHRHSDGNPLFMTSMLDHLVHQGVVSQAAGRWILTTPLEQVDPGVPETLRQMLEMQLQHTNEAQQRLLTCASIVGQRFTAWAVANMLSDETAHIEELCEGLVQRQQFLKAAGVRDFASGTTAVEYAFRHWLYRDVLYRRLNPASRIGFHCRLAEGFASLGSAVQSEMAAEIALHFEEGHQYGSAVQYLLLTAQNAARRYAHGQAVAILEHAAQLLPRVQQRRRDLLDLQILEKMGTAYYALGEMDRAASVYESMATRAADAGLLTEQAEALARRAHPAESIPFFLRAIELRPRFAAAYVALSRIYSNIGETERAKVYARQAYECGEQSGERERLSIRYQYHYEVTGDQESATATLEEWKRLFPLEFEPANSLALIHNFLGRFERAIDEGLEAVRRNPSHGYPYSNLAHAYRGLGKFDDARRTAERAVALDIETLPTRCLLYQLATATGEEKSAAQHLEWARDKPREFDMIGARAQTLGWLGRVREARQVYEEAGRLAERRDFPDVGTNHLAWATAMELAYGNTDHAVEQARRVLGRNPGYDSQLRAALTLAVAGVPRAAEQIADDQAAANPEHTLINAVLIPIVRAGIDIGRGNPRCAIQHLEVVAPYELGFIAALAPVYLRGQSYLMLGMPREAAEQFQRILDHRGTDPFSPFHAVAPLGLARACAAAGDVDRSLKAYRRFLTAWTNADRDVPVLLEARHEHDRLLRAATSNASVG